MFSRDDFLIPRRDQRSMVQHGLVKDQSMIHKFGRNASVPVGEFQFINALGFTDWPLDAPTKVRIKAGGDAADTVGGLGTQGVVIQGIDDNFREITEILPTNGILASADSAASFWRVHRQWPSTVGTYGGNNIGTVTIENAAGGTDLICMNAGDGASLFGAWTVPGDKVAFLIGIVIIVRSNQPADVRGFTRRNFDITSGAMSPKRMLFDAGGLTGFNPYSTSGPAARLDPKTDLWIEASGNAGMTSVSVLMELDVYHLEVS